MKRFFCLLLAAALTFGTPASAQQVSANANLPGLPAGISVMVTATVPVEKWLENASFTGPQGQSQAERFVAAVEAAGVPSSEVTIIPDENFLFSRTNPSPTVQLTYAASLAGRVSQLAHSLRMTQLQMHPLPADAQELYDRALALAVQDGRMKAGAIASADRQHVGRLLNFLPSPLEMAKQLASSRLSAFANATDGGVTASGIATFELIP